MHRRPALSLGRILVALGAGLGIGLPPLLEDDPRSSLFVPPPRRVRFSRVVGPNGPRPCARRRGGADYARFLDGDRARRGLPPIHAADYRRIT